MHRYAYVDLVPQIPSGVLGQLAFSSFHDPCAMSFASSHVMLIVWRSCVLFDHYDMIISLYSTVRLYGLESRGRCAVLKSCSVYRILKFGYNDPNNMIKLILFRLCF